MKKIITIEDVREIIEEVLTECGYSYKDKPFIEKLTERIFRAI